MSLRVLKRADRHGRGPHSIAVAVVENSLDHPPVIFDVNLDEWDEKVIQASHQRPIVADFWAEWCPPCRVIAPNLYRAMDVFEGAVALAKVDMDESDNMKLGGRFAVRGFPSILLFQYGELKARFCGADTYHRIVDFIVNNTDLPVRPRDD